MEKEGAIVELLLDDDMGHMLSLALHLRWSVVFAHCSLGQNAGYIVKRAFTKLIRPIRSVLSTHLWHAKRFSMARSCLLAPRGGERQTSSSWWKASIAAATRFYLPRLKVTAQSQNPWRIQNEDGDPPGLDDIVSTLIRAVHVHFPFGVSHELRSCTVILAHRHCGLQVEMRRKTR